MENSYLNRFTDNLQQVLSVAEEAAVAYDSSYIGSEHIVFAMLNCPDCTAYKVLNACGVSEPEYREYFSRSIDTRSNIKGYTPRTKHMIERALDLSIEFNGQDSLAGTEHMLYVVWGLPCNAYSSRFGYKRNQSRFQAGTCAYGQHERIFF